MAESFADAVREALGPQAASISLETVPVCPSTNRDLKERADALPAWHALIALEQTQGRGRLGRSFFSPGGTGLYMSVLLRPELAPEDVSLLTPAAAVAVCRALEELGADRARIKWVNDVYINGRKVCGILTEAGPCLDYVVVGIGVNVSPPADGFPPDITDIAGAVFPADGEDRRAPLAAAVLRQLYEICGRLPDLSFADEYRARSFLTGRQVDVFQGDFVRRALVLGTDERCRLLVRFPDGAKQALFSGDVSVRPLDGE